MRDSSTTQRFGALVISAALASSACNRSEPGVESAGPQANTTPTTTVAAATASSTETSTSAAAAVPTIDNSQTTLPKPDEGPVPTSAAELAAALTAAENAIRRSDLDPSLTAAWGRRQQQLYQILAANPVWVDEVLGSVAPPIGEAAALNWEAGQELDALLDSSELLATLPAWRVLEPRPAEELIGYYQEAEETTGVPWEVLAAINLIETRMGRINGVSTAGALGPMQFLPSTWEECCSGDPTDDGDAIRGAAKYLIDRGGAKDLDRALFGYNNSDHYVGAVQAYAAVLALDQAAYAGYHAWEVYFLSTAGLVRLPIGYEQHDSVDAATWIEANPDGLVKLTPSS